MPIPAVSWTCLGLSFLICNWDFSLSWGLIWNDGHRAPSSGSDLSLRHSARYCAHEGSGWLGNWQYSAGEASGGTWTIIRAGRFTLLAPSPTHLQRTLKNSYLRSQDQIHFRIDCFLLSWGEGLDLALLNWLFQLLAACSRRKLIVADWISPGEDGPLPFHMVLAWVKWDQIRLETRIKEVPPISLTHGNSFLLFWNGDKLCDSMLQGGDPSCIRMFWKSTGQ